MITEARLRNAHLLVRAEVIACLHHGEIPWRRVHFGTCLSRQITSFKISVIIRHRLGCWHGIGETARATESASRMPCRSSRVNEMPSEKQPSSAAAMLGEKMKMLSLVSARFGAAGARQPASTSRQFLLCRERRNRGNCADTGATFSLQGAHGAEQKAIIVKCHYNSR